MRFTRTCLSPILIVCLIAVSSSINAQDRAAGSSDDLASVIEQCEKAVVRIEIQASPNGPADEGLGSGFVVDSSGIIATNMHVLADAYSAKVIFPDGKSAQILGTLVTDVGRDICIAKIDAKDLPALSFADALPRKGEKVVALGCPIGLSFTATVGIVSAVRSEKEMQKDLGVAELRGTWIQVDAAISPGNSGGPLINESGQVVAMSTLASVGIAQNLNFGVSGEDVGKLAGGAKNQKLVKFNSSNARGNSIASQPRSMGRSTRGGTAPPSRRGPGTRVPDTRSSLTIEQYIEGGPTGNTARGSFTNKRPAGPEDQAALTAYVKSGRQLYSALYQDLVSAIRVCELDIESYRIDAEKRNAKNERTSDFRDDERKEKLAETSAELIRLTAIRDALTPTVTDESLYKLLQTHGPAVNLKTKDSVGILGKCRVLGVMSDKALFIDIEGGDGIGWSLLWVDSANDFHRGELLNIGPVIMTGYEPSVTPPGTSTNVKEFPVLLAVSNEQIKPLVFGESVAKEKPAGEDFRTWSDLTGKFKVEAVLVNVDGDTVHLRRRDGVSITVPKVKLSPDDHKFLK